MSRWRKLKAKSYRSFDYRSSTSSLSTSEPEQICTTEFSLSRYVWFYFAL
ncbi:hypothetical protein TcasGA2_TC034939 [Tribolium castaneum]|uniref:Uncharacterized protein n=1 Tax=Tribolium castaneum TaxID=7070 RepID=A0A139WA32_TRICA|nr:hypothetical protein TcasGA2_TC034939 [Tribolium castaneum]